MFHALEEQIEKTQGAARSPEATALLGYRAGAVSVPTPCTFIWPLSKDATAQVTFSGGAVRAAHQDQLAKLFGTGETRLGSRRRGIEYGGFSITSVSFRGEAARNLARAASVLLKSSPKKGIHREDIPLSIGMSGQFCTYWSFRFPSFAGIRRRIRHNGDMGRSQQSFELAGSVVLAAG